MTTVVYLWKAYYSAVHYNTINYSLQNTHNRYTLHTLSIRVGISIFNGLVQERYKYIANTLELRLSCSNPLFCEFKVWCVSYFSNCNNVNGNIMLYCILDHVIGDYTQGIDIAPLLFTDFWLKSIQ